MKTLLITAFEPFGGESENPSALALELLPETIGGIRLEKRLLEVTFLGAKDAVCRYADEIKPDYAICLGQAGGRAAITPERVAINVMDARIADNAGYKPEDEPVVTGGANAHFATLPIKRMVSAMERANVARRYQTARAHMYATARCMPCLTILPRTTCLYRRALYTFPISRAKLPISQTCPACRLRIWSGV